MKFISILIVTLSIGCLGGALAQDQRNPPSQGQHAGIQANSSRDAAQGGTTGAGASGADEPLTATGLDLHGPAIKFPSGKAPE